MLVTIPVHPVCRPDSTLAMYQPERLRFFLPSTTFYRYCEHHNLHFVLEGRGGGGGPYLQTTLILELVFRGTRSSLFLNLYLYLHLYSCTLDIFLIWDYQVALCQSQFRCTLSVGQTVPLLCTSLRGCCFFLPSLPSTRIVNTIELTFAICREGEGDRTYGLN